MFYLCRKLFLLTIKIKVMSKEKVLQEVTIKRNLKLECIICKKKLFWTRTTLMNTPGMSFFNLDWANKSAVNYVCDNCGYVHWFLNK